MNIHCFSTFSKGLLRPAVFPNCSRAVHRIPHYENHIRFSPLDGRKRPCQDALDRFKRLNNGMWIKSRPGRSKHRYMKDEIWNATSLDYETCTKEECGMLDKMTTPFWMRKTHYTNDPYEPYNVRHGIRTPRVDYRFRLIREREKVLLDDTTSLRFMFDR